jgi:O-antigen ligase
LVNRRSLDGLLRTLTLAAAAIGLYGLSYILHAVGWLPGFLYLPLNQGQGIGLYQGYVELNLYSLSSLLFMVPFLTGALLIWSPAVNAPVSRRALWAALAPAVLLVLLSGRRALLLVVALAPLIALALRAFLPAAERRGQRRLVVRFAIVGAAALVALLVYLQLNYGLTVTSLWHMFTEGFQFTRDVSASARRQQFYALLQGWADAPLLGAGHGASAPGSLRSADQPWAYELSYLALLFHTGLVGFLAYAAGVAWIFWMGVRMIRAGGPDGSRVLPILTGLTCFLIGNATNPYLEKYDLMWVIFLPVAFINSWLLRQRPRPG